MYQAIYKCRLCGEIYINDTKFKPLLKESAIINCINKGAETHECKDESVGIADFQGFKKVGD